MLTLKLVYNGKKASHSFSYVDGIVWEYDWWILCHAEKERVDLSDWTIQSNQEY